MSSRLTLETRETFKNDKAAVKKASFGGMSYFIVKSPQHVLGRLGSDLLSQGLSQSTIGAAALNDRVRNGIGFYHCAITTKSAEHML
jgi:hypothetical protein